MYYIDWSDPVFPRIRKSDDDTGDTLDTVVTQLIRHHLEIVKAQCTAIERLVNDVPG